MSISVKKKPKIQLQEFEFRNIMRNMNPNEIKLNNLRCMRICYICKPVKKFLYVVLIPEL